LFVPGGSFDRHDNPAYPATISSFWLDKYEITVARMRAFVEAYPLSRPGPGDGENPHLPGSGWRPEWDALVDKTQLLTDLNCMDHSWSPLPEDDRRPITCLTYYAAFAFCAWDGGRLPTRAEWSYAAAGGSEQRAYPWSAPGTPGVIDSMHANYGRACAGCSARDLLEVGSLPLGNGRWGHADLAGNVWEWNLDGEGPPSPSCHDCALLAGAGNYIIAGGSVIDPAITTSVANDFNGWDGTQPWFLLGARCAR
jgi:formylglycine-generating enzyme required for sulfatase activity